jgi:elongation factor G
MAKYSTEHIRNVALLGHGGSGKTALAEALLFDTKAITRLGRVEDGSTVSDWDPEEQRRGISINVSVAPVEYDHHKFNLLDAPGYLDFISEVVSALQSAEAGLILVDAVAGAEVGTELAWDRVLDLGKPRLIFINKMDRENANFSKAVESLQTTLTGSKIIPLQLPIGSAHDLKGVVSLVSMEAYLGAEGKVAPIPDDMADEVEAARMALVEAAAQTLAPSHPKHRVYCPTLRRTQTAV